ncbi:MAG TPA: carboxypeptidase regulatory-like domain-containing protein [Candidatus Saccharimonadales bacterium]|jgi:hypothetical protein|nr:carboxypeptidase regulatory-like domain-containing protein [Candidatus Saccharimonadales bacterium]
MKRSLQFLLLAAWALLSGSGLAVPQQPAQTGELEIRVLDDHGAPVFPASVVLQHGGERVAHAESGQAGLAAFHLSAGTYKVIVEKRGFYKATVETVSIVAGQVTPLEIRLQPVKEFHEEVEVAASPSPIDPQQSSSVHTLTAEDVSSIPYSTTRDYRNVLQFFPGVIRDINGQIHVAGGAQQQTQDYLDGLEISQPAGGGLGVRLNPESLRKITVESSRYSAQFGKGSAGLASFETLDGANKFHESATDFIPTLQNVKHPRLNNWTPRASFSGPLLRDRAWFLISHEGEIDSNIVRELPDGQDENRVWRSADLLKVKIALNPKNTLLVDGLLNLTNSRHAGISRFAPISTSTNQNSAIFVGSVKDQVSIAKDSLWEFGYGELYSRATEAALGFSPYTVTPFGSQGNYFRTTGNYSVRQQGFTNVFLRPRRWGGGHQLAFGGSLARVTLYQYFIRIPIFFTNLDGTNNREVLFQNVPAYKLHTTEPSAWFQDRWSPVSRLLIEAGVRWDSDSKIGKDFFSPRIAGALLLAQASETKLSLGIGTYYDRTSLSLLARPFQGLRTDLFFLPGGVTLSHAPLVTTFAANPGQLQMPRFTNWSAGIERRMPGRIYLRADYLNRRGVHGWGYENQPNGSSILKDHRQDRYDAIQLTARREIKRGYPVMVAYTRSWARTNEFLDFGPDFPVFGNQIGGPQPWDAPHQIVSHGVLPLAGKLKKFDLAYSFLWRTGFPFITVNDFQELVDGPAAHRFPDFMTLNPALERKFIFRRYRWAGRVGIDNATSRSNPLFVNNVTTSPFFLQFVGLSHRSLNGRIRFLGKE